LSKIPYKELPHDKVELPNRHHRGDYKKPDYPYNVIPEASMIPLAGWRHFLAPKPLMAHPNARPTTSRSSGGPNATQLPVQPEKS
jgi:hypothetical protein